ncbi:MAG TPA: hypothetical protein VMW72_09535 [Sedimentisphaerales bacterium]|nr:hypothetical protein [Sedimentisphaerales bacterium]
MKVFISWSGKTSGELAKIFRDWLPSVIQAVKPYYSTDDIAKGMRGNTVIAKELEQAGVGLICLTPDNLDAPWIMFEAGALSKKLDTSRVCPILFAGLETTDLKGPLVPFQAAKFNKEEIRKMLTMVNKELGEDALETKVLDSVFEKWWPDLEQRVESLLSEAPESAPRTVRNDRELLEEILTITRSMSTQVRLTASLQRHAARVREPGQPLIGSTEAIALASLLKEKGWTANSLRSVLEALSLPAPFIHNVLLPDVEEHPEQQMFPLK